MMGIGGAFVPRPRLANTDMNIVFDGDSLTAGINNTGIDQYFPKEIRDFLQPKCNSLTFNSFGVSGQNTQQMLSDIGTQILPLYNASKTNVIIAWEDVNAILNAGRTAAQNIADFENYFGQCKTAGFDYCILILGYYPRKRIDGTYNQTSWDTGSPTRLDVQADYYDIVKANGMVGVDVIVDLRTNPILGGARNQQLTTQAYFEDSVHLQALGYDEIVTEVINQGLYTIFSN